MKFIKDAASDTACVYLDLEDTKLPNLKADIEPLLHFNITTYNNLKISGTDEDFDKTFKYPNMFLATLTEEQKVLFASNIIVMHNEILCTINSNVINLDDHAAASRNNAIMYQLEGKLAEMISKLDEPDQLDLFNRLYEFSNEHISLVEKDGMGERPQDSAEKTFWLSEQRIIVTWFLICKLFTVIIGTFIERCKSIEMDANWIARHGVAIFKYILCKDDGRVAMYNKMYSIVSNTIVKAIAAIKDYEKKQASYLFNGDTPDTVIDRTMAEIFTRKAITTDLSKIDTNIAALIHKAAQKLAQHCNKSTDDNAYVCFRAAPNENAYADNEEGNDSILEIESANTTCTADINAILSFAVNDIVKRYTQLHEFDQVILKQTIAYYTEINHISLTPINSYLLCILFGNDLMGSKSIELLTSKDLAALTAVMQMYFITYEYYDLVHLVSLVNTGGIKASLTGSESKLKSAYMNNKAFRVCADRFKFEINGVTWCTSLANIIKTITTYRYQINTAFSIWGLLEREPLNGYEYAAPDTLGESICRLILNCTENEG